MRYRRTNLSAIIVTALAVGAFACTRTPTPATQSANPQQRAAVGENGRGGGAGGEGRGGGRGGPGGQRVRRPPNYEAQDSLRRATVAEVLQQIAGREHEPAGRVFKNVRILRAVPADEFLKTMDETYGRGLGYTCTNCYVDKNFADDTKKGKVIAREMQLMTNAINKQHLSKMKELDDDYQKATCVSCHKSTEKVNNKMTQPTNAPG